MLLLNLNYRNVENGSNDLYLEAVADVDDVAVIDAVSIPYEFENLCAKVKKDEEAANAVVLPKASSLIPLNPKLSPGSATGCFRLAMVNGSSWMKMM